MDARGWPITSVWGAPLSSSAIRSVVAAIALMAAGLWCWPGDAAGQGGTATVVGTIALRGPAPLPTDRSGVVVWLTKPEDAEPGRPAPAQTRPRARITQREKRFLPRVLVVPAGSAVDFPNLDPIFHNVFSLFDGKRFDLGLYEAGTSRSVTFTTPGVSYIFCNIHPEMSAFVVAVNSDHYATSNQNGVFSMAGVRPGRYTAHVWHDRFKPEGADAYPRELTVPAAGLSLGTLTLIDTGQALAAHKNKFGHDYIPPDAAAPIYR